MSRIIDFCWYARERQSVFYKRRKGSPYPWTNDPIIGSGRFCNVYREDDATTRWFAEWVRDPIRNKPEVLLATVLFRWFNRTTTGDAIFRQLGDYTPDGRGTIRTAWDQYLGDVLLGNGDIGTLKYAITKFVGNNGPYVTGAYIIKTPDGMSKLDGVLWCVEQFTEKSFIGQYILPDWMVANSKMDWLGYAEAMLVSDQTATLEQVWNWLRNFPFLGDFMAYEIVTDLRHTALLEKAPDIYTWANPGPGAMRGLNRLHGRPLNFRQKKQEFIREMRELLEKIDDMRTEAAHVWPHRIGFDVEMRDIEHTLCEFDKYERVRLGEGKMKQVYRYSGR